MNACLVFTSSAVVDGVKVTALEHAGEGGGHSVCVLHMFYKLTPLISMYTNK